ncbi:MAG: CoA pyrophosphatase [Proteobacteria bacterium]|nr:CoA pyrophosphatase [Pseudomonadota bacterium]
MASKVSLPSNRHINASTFNYLPAGSHGTGEICAPLMRERILAVLKNTAPASDPVEAALAGDLPERARKLIRPETLVPAAVLIPLVGATDTEVILTRRAGHLKHHAGQISFPGGRLEKQDAGPLAAALREAEEEIGLDPACVEIAGYLTPYITITGYVVTPVVGFLRSGYTVAADQVEVDEVFKVPMAFLLNPDNWVRRNREFMGVPVTYHEIPWQDRNIWGATAAMLIAFSKLLSKNNIL